VCLVSCAGKAEVCSSPRAYDFSQLSLDEPKLSTLEDDEVAVIQFRSQGCFHFDRYEFTFTGPMPLEVTAKKQDFRDPSNSDPLPGKVWLDEVTVERLDRLLAFYRTAPEGGCTTEDFITIEWNAHGTWSVTESFHDDTCDVRSPDVLPLAHLARLLGG
jgi:hypothetical protein